MQTELFSIMDTDGNGQLSQAEFSVDNQHKARQLAHKRAVFKDLDHDQNELLSADEFPSPLAHLAAADANADGLITKAEMKAFRAASRSSRRSFRQSFRQSEAE